MSFSNEAAERRLTSESEQQGVVRLQISLLNEKKEILASTTNVFTVRDDSSVTEGQSQFADNRVYLPSQSVFFPER